MLKSLSCHFCGVSLETLRTYHKHKITNRLVNFRTRDTLDKTENQFEEFSFLLASSQEKQRLLRSSPSINYPINQCRRRPSHAHTEAFAASHNRGECPQKHRDCRKRQKETENDLSFSFFSLPFSLSLSFLRYRSRVVRAITPGEKKEKKIHPPRWISSTKITNESPIVGAIREREKGDEKLLKRGKVRSESERKEEARNVVHKGVEAR